jgi:ABC-type branched-subunit amino acid transport system ATPase component
VTATMLELTGLSGGYGDVVIVDGISLSLGARQVCCVTGRNGVGKTTLMRLITGMLTPRSGRVTLGERDITHIAPHRCRELGMTYAPQENVVFDTLSVMENLTLHHADRALDRYAALFELFPRIRERLHQPAGTLSGGERKILSFCRAMAEGSRFTMLDEPTEGVQPENIHRMADVVQAAKVEGRSFLIVEQNLSFVEQVADDVLLLDHGNIVFASPFGPLTRAQLQQLMTI